VVEALDYEDPLIDRDGRRVDLGVSVRLAAVSALAGFDSRIAEQGLLKAMRDPEVSVRTHAVKAVSRRSGPIATAVLINAAATWRDPWLAPARRQAVTALAGLEGPGASLAYAHSVLKAAAEPDELDAVMLRRLSGFDGGASLRPVLDLLADGLADDWAAEQAGELLARLAPESVPVLIGALVDPLRAEPAAAALGRARDSRAVGPLAQLLSWRRPAALRRTAARALGEIGSPAGAEPLLVATGDSDFAVRREALAGFNKLGNVGVAVVLGAILREALAGETSVEAPGRLGTGEGSPTARPERLIPGRSPRAQTRRGGLWGLLRRLQSDTPDRAPAP
jgi:HEAT repeat protein